MVLAAAATVYYLANEGRRAVLLQRVEVVEESVKYRPDQPGYLELVGATPTLLALHTHRGELAGVTFMARTGIDAGGGIVLLSPDLRVMPRGADGADGEFLGEAFSEGGAAAVQPLAETLFGVGFDETVELSTDDMAAAMEAAGPLPYLLVDDLVEVGADGSARVAHPAGPTDLDAASAAAVYAFRNPDEADVNRLERQRAVWESWLGVIGRAEDTASGVVDLETGLFPYLRALSAGTAVIEIPPMRSVAPDPGSPPFYELDEEGWSWLRERSLEMVPWPRQPESFWRPRVQLLDGTGDPSAREALAADVISAGGVITVIGNAGQFDVATTRFDYHRKELVTDPIVNTIAFELGVDMALVEPREGIPDLADITVTVGSDKSAL